MHGKLIVQIFDDYKCDVHAQNIDFIYTLVLVFVYKY